MNFVSGEVKRNALERYETMNGSKATTILMEETIRAMAVFGVLAFGVVPLAYRLGMQGGAALLGALGIAFGGCVLFVLLRLKTGRELKVRSRRGWIASAAVGVGIVILVDLASYLVVGPDATRPWWHILAAILIAALFTWLNMRKRGTDS